MTWCSLFSLMCGEGGMAIGEWRRMRDVGLANLWIKGYAKRHRTTLEVGRVLAKVTASCVCKDLPDDFPYTLPWDTPEDTRTEEEKKADLEKARPALEEALKRMLGQQNKEQTNKQE